MLRKGSNPYEYRDNYQRFNESHYQTVFNHSNLNMEDITNDIYSHAKIMEDFKLKKIRSVRAKQCIISSKCS